MLNTKDQALFAYREQGPPMNPGAIDLVMAAAEFLEDNPDARTTVQFVHSYGGETRYTLLGAALLLEGVDLEILDPQDRWHTGCSLLVEDLGFSTYDIYALEEINSAAQSPFHLRELVEAYIECPRRVPLALQDKAPVDW